MKQETLTRLYALLGRAVLLPVPKGNKGCKLPAWQLTTWEKTQTDAYRRQLVSHGNIGVLLGNPSQNLISVDCDGDDFLQDFLAANPALRNTLISKGRRGGNVWLRMSGDYPSTYRLTRDGQPWGEFRSNGAQTIIAGLHPEGGEYHLFHDARPLNLAFNEIHWPEGVLPANAPDRGAGERGSTLSLHSSPSTPLYDIPSPEAVAVLESFQKEHSHLFRIYDRLISPLLPVAKGSRNLTLTAEIVPRLYGAMSFSAAGLVLHMLIESHKLGGYPPAEARSKFASAWKGLEISWLLNLSPPERRTLDGIQNLQCRETFRICRELAMNVSDEKFPPPNFYLSSESLAARLGLRTPSGKLDSQTAWRTLRKLTRDYCILYPLDPGKAHGHKERGKTATFAWCFPLPCAQAA